MSLYFPLWLTDYLNFGCIYTLVSMYGYLQFMKNIIHLCWGPVFIEISLIVRFSSPNLPLEGGKPASLRKSPDSSSLQLRFVCLKGENISFLSLNLSAKRPLSFISKYALILEQEIWTWQKAVCGLLGAKPGSLTPALI